MNAGCYDYGRAGTIGIGAPQANPTVEAEMRILLPPNIAMTVARLTSAARDPQDRLRAYLERLDDTLSQFDSLRPAIFAFACTGSSYLVAPAREAAIVRCLEDRLGCPVVTATAAIRWRLQAIGAERIALVAPYPDWLADAAAAYWRSTGFDVTDVRRIDTGTADTRSIYQLGSADARAAVDELRASPVDAVLVSGTGMPSLPLIAAASDGPPVISSNLCLAERLCAELGRDLSDWRGRLRDATGQPAGAPIQ